MPLILGLIGFILATFVALTWVAVWLVAALVWLLWPLALLVMGAVMWRSQTRYWHRVSSTAAASPGPHRSQSVFKEGGNAAFDEYREETLQRLDEERERFRTFLDRLRKAKDKEAFDRFMSERRPRPSNGTQGLIA